MNIPFVSFKPLEKKLDTELRAAFERVYTHGISKAKKMKLLKNHLQNIVIENIV